MDRKVNREAGEGVVAQEKRYQRHVVVVQMDRVELAGLDVTRHRLADRRGLLGHHPGVVGIDRLGAGPVHLPVVPEVDHLERDFAPARGQVKRLGERSFVQLHVERVAFDRGGIVLVHTPQSVG